MDGGAHPDHRRQVFSADFPQGRHLHDAGVSRATIQQQSSNCYGDLLARRLRLCQPHGYSLARRHGGSYRLGHQRSDCIDCARRVRRCLCPLRRVKSGGAYGHRPGLAAGTRRPQHVLSRPEQDLRQRRDGRRLSRADCALSRKIQNDSPAEQPELQEPPGLSVLLGGMWVMNVSYWGFNQYIIQRALGAKDIREAQKGIVLAAFLKLLMPVIIVLPGIAAAALAPNLARPDEAYPHLMAMLPTGILGLVFAALIAAIVASMGSKINSIATIFTMDVYRPLRPQTSQQRLVLIGRITAVVALIVAILSAKPLLGSFDQAFQYIQEFTGFFTPGICVIFLLGMFWERCTVH